MFLPIGYIMTAAGFQNECGKDRRVPANIGLIFSAIYAALIFIVYFAQTTTVRLEDLTDQAKKILDYSRGGLLFNLDLLGYAMMALSTFFIGLSMRSKNSPDKWLKALMTFHGVFFISCFVLPMTGAFASMSSGGTHGGGVAALVVWCVYFLPIGILSFRHFSDSK
ncbi:MAG: hypothetical protein IJV00_08815 [Clostridia bacterium]|nr:hypothetical protein [Clostridia bacterium]